MWLPCTLAPFISVAWNHLTTTTLATPEDQKLYEALVLHDQPETRWRERESGGHRHCYLRCTPSRTIWPKTQVQFAYCCWFRCCACSTHTFCWLNWVVDANALPPLGPCNRSISFGVIIFVQKTLNTIQLIDTGATNELTSSALHTRWFDLFYSVDSIRSFSHLELMRMKWNNMCVCCACERTNCLSINLCNFSLAEFGSMLWQPASQWKNDLGHRQVFYDNQTQKKGRQRT